MSIQDIFQRLADNLINEELSWRDLGRELPQGEEVDDCREELRRVCSRVCRTDPARIWLVFEAFTHEVLERTLNLSEQELLESALAHPAYRHGRDAYEAELREREVAQALAFAPPEMFAVSDLAFPP